MLEALHLGQRARIEPVDCSVYAAGIPVIAVAEDRHRVLSPHAELREPSSGADRLVREASYRTWEIGQVVTREQRGIFILDVIVYDLDQEPVTSAEYVRWGLEALMETLSRKQLTTVAIEPIGVAHSGISPPDFALNLHSALRLAPIGLHLLVCDEDRAALADIFSAMEVAIDSPVG